MLPIGVRRTVSSLSLVAAIPAALAAQTPADTARRPDSTAVPTNTTPLPPQQPTMGAQGGAQPTQGPASITYKGVTITPIGFFAGEAIWRQRNETADISSSFNAIPYSNSTNGQLSEFRLSSRQSRLGVAAAGKLNEVTIGGYMEGDFQSAGISSNSNQSNSYTFRVRQFFGQAAFANGVTFSAGQMWSLLTPNKTGVANRAEYNPGTIDGQYTVGYDWARQVGFRVADKLSSGLSIAGAVEESQTTFSGRNAPTQIVIGQTGGNILNSSANYSTDLAPDLVGKIALDPGYGHFEVKGIARFFRDRIVDTLGTFGGSRNNTSLGWGVGGSAIFPNPNLADVGLHVLYGKGIGRYGTSGLADVTANPDGTLEPIRAVHALVTVDAHPTKMLDVYGYGGGEYADRTTALNASGKSVGYGNPTSAVGTCDLEVPATSPYVPGAGSCAADTRLLWEGTLGFWYRFYRGPGGTFQWGMQYSYLHKNAWAGAPSGAYSNTEPVANDQMVFTSFRYYLP